MLMPAVAWLAVCAGLGSVAEPTTFVLWPDGAPNAMGNAEKDIPTLIAYPLADGKHCAVVICPGGGYGRLAMDHEGYQIARWFNERGVAAFILNYRHRGKGYGHPAPLQDAQRAIRTVRARAQDWNVDPQRIGIMGFSAGGHLASSASTHFEQGDSAATDPIAKMSSRPDFAILCYPVIAFDEPFTHRGSQRNLLGKDASPELVRKMSSEKQVSSETPPTFLWHTTDDKPVPPENSVVYYLALRKAGVPAEMHVFEKGRHGLGLASSVEGTKMWSQALHAWLQNRQLLEIESE